MSHTDPIDNAFPTQAQVLEWVRRQWPDRTTPIWRAAKLGEEVADVPLNFRDHFRGPQGRKTVDDIRMETAQVAICAMAVAESCGFDLWDAVMSEWERVGRPLLQGDSR